MTIGDRLLKLRRERNLSQEDLANVLDVSRQTISKWETNQSMPDFDKIVPLCNYFGITTDELLTGTKDLVEAQAKDVKSNFARNIAIAVMIYILSLVVEEFTGAQNKFEPLLFCFLGSVCLVLLFLSLFFSLSNIVSHMPIFFL